MEYEQAIKIITQALEIGQKKGLFSLKDASVIQKTLEYLTDYVKNIPEAPVIAKSDTDTTKDE